MEDARTGKTVMAEPKHKACNVVPPVGGLQQIKHDNKVDSNALSDKDADTAAGDNTTVTVAISNIERSLCFVSKNKIGAVW